MKTREQRHQEFVKAMRLAYIYQGIYLAIWALLVFSLCKLGEHLYNDWMLGLFMSPIGFFPFIGLSLKWCFDALEKLNPNNN